MHEVGFQEQSLMMEVQTAFESNSLHPDTAYIVCINSSLYSVAVKASNFIKIN